MNPTTMTTELTTDEKRVKIAEACGYRRNERNVWGYGSKTEDDGLQLPDFLRDLNAMHEAEKVLTYAQQPRYIHILRHRVLMCDEGVSDFDLMHATASMRAEAFGQTLNLWPPDPVIAPYGLTSAEDRPL